ncbi:MAG: methyltransferase domain-containing protein [Acidobacteriota bacterium]|jgi:arsenite methyltransferase
MSMKHLDPEHSSEIRSSVKSKYREVAVKAEGHFPYPTGRESALKLGYDPSWLESVPGEVVERFVGVGNPFSIRMPKPGERILDAGCGCGMDAFVSSILVGPEGRVSGVDLTAEMLALPRTISARSEQWNVEFREASIEELPYKDGAFDIVISNGVLNLIPDKKSAFSELARVLRPDGILASADLLVMEKIPPDVLASKDAWST